MTNMHKSARGSLIDMAKLSAQNELTVAVSNVKINARGDELGPGGQIIRNTPNTDVSSIGGIPVEQPFIRETINPTVQRKETPAPTVVEESLRPVFTPVTDTDTQNALIHPVQLKKGK